MIEPNNPDINVDDIMERIRMELANRGTERVESPQEADNVHRILTDSVELERINTSFATAEANAAIGTQLSEMTRFPLPIRWVARLMGRVVLYLSEIIAFPQRTFNQQTLLVMRKTVDNIWQAKHELKQLARRADSLNRKIESLNRETSEISMVSKKLVDDRKTDRSQFEHLNSHLKARISYQEHRMDLLFKEVRQCLPDKLDQAQVTRIADEAKRSFDPYYVMFTDQFRGDRNTVMNRFEIYLSFFGKPNIETEKYPVLDVGCGRGEWMELMKDRGFHAKGIDINSILIEQNLVRGLNVARADFKNFLPELPDGSQGTITAFHLIEHISLEDLFFLLNEILRALKPGGRAIFETPNPENILVGSANFYMDPTHRNPIPAALMKFLMEQRGFSDVEIIWLNPYPETNRINDNDSELAKRFNQFFYGPQDYGVIGIKA